MFKLFYVIVVSLKQLLSFFLDKNVTSEMPVPSSAEHLLHPVGCMNSAVDSWFLIIASDNSFT